MADQSDRRGSLRDAAAVENRSEIMESVSAGEMRTAVLFPADLQIPELLPYCCENTKAIRTHLWGRTMKQPITIRLDPDLLAAARMKAKEENRTLTNFLETALKERFEPGSPISSQSAYRPKSVRKRNLKR